MNFSEYLKQEHGKYNESNDGVNSQMSPIAKIKEDMLGPADSSGTIIVNPEVPGQIMQTPNSLVTGMDTFALAGPGKKKKTKSKKTKKKESHSSNRVGSFLDFVSRKH